MNFATHTTYHPDTGTATLTADDQVVTVTVPGDLTGAARDAWIQNWSVQVARETLATLPSPAEAT